jgi:hypothetical protein
VSYHFYDLYSDELNKGKVLTKFLIYEFYNITKKGWMCVIMISFSQLGFMTSKVQLITTVHDG